MKLVVALACIALAACGAAKKEAAGAPPPQMVVPSVPENPHAEIERLDQDIATAMHKDQLTVLDVSAQAMESIPKPLTGPQCKPARSDACDTSCDLSNSICKNADRICDLANGMAGDDWAATKCKSARQSCADANQKCCTCML